MRLDLATAEYIGARAQQQDEAAAIPLKVGALLVLADGLGGHESGAEASHIVIETFRKAAGAGRFDRSETRRDALREILEEANARIGAGVDPAHGQRGMASTAVAAVVADGEMSWVSVGDSHLYVWRDGRLAKLNEDHSQAGLMLRSGQYKPDDPEVQAVKSVLVSALTGRTLEIVDLPLRSFRVEGGDIVILASDGLNTLDDGEIAQIVAERKDDGAVGLSTVLLETVRSRRIERQDNTTVSVALVHESVERTARTEVVGERTITHQVRVLTDEDQEPRTERVAREAITERIESRKPARAGAGSITPDRQEQSGEASGSAAADPDPHGVPAAETGASLAAAAVEPVVPSPESPPEPRTERLDPSTARGRAGGSVGLPAQAKVAAKAAPASSGERSASPAKASRRLIPLLLLCLLAALAALGAVVLLRPDVAEPWLPGWAGFAVRSGGAKALKPVDLGGPVAVPDALPLPRLTNGSATTERGAPRTVPFAAPAIAPPASSQPPPAAEAEPRLVEPPREVQRPAQRQ